MMGVDQAGHHQAIGLGDDIYIIVTFAGRFCLGGDCRNPSVFDMDGAVMQKVVSAIEERPHIEDALSCFHLRQA